MSKNQKGLASIMIILIMVVILAGGVFAWQYLRFTKDGAENQEYQQESEEQSVPLAIKNVFINFNDYVGQKFRFQGCFEPHKCTMANEECDIDNLTMCCDCIKKHDICLITDLQSVPREKLTKVRETDETKYYVEVLGIIVSSPKMRPIMINAIDLTILGNCPSADMD